MSDFDINMEAYTPPPVTESAPFGGYGYTLGNPITAFDSDFQIDLAQYTPPPDNPTGAIGGWLNSIANLIPSVQKGLSSFLGNKGSDGAPLSQTTQALNSAKTSGGVVSQAKNSSGILGFSPVTQSAPTLWLIIGAIALIVILFVRK